MATYSIPRLMSQIIFSLHTDHRMRQKIGSTRLPLNIHLHVQDTQASAFTKAELRVRELSLFTCPSLGNMTHSLSKCSLLLSESQLLLSLSSHCILYALLLGRILLTETNALVDDTSVPSSTILLF